MSNIENGIQYMHQQAAEAEVSILFRDYPGNLGEFNKYLDLLIDYVDVIPHGTVFYRGRTIGMQTYCDLEVVTEENRQFFLYGFAPTKMLAPPAEISTPGRANKKGESFLYLANKPEVCCAEVRPIFTEMISVFQFTLNKDIRVMNLKTCNIEKASLIQVEMLKKVMLTFVEPIKDQSDENYSLTQYIASYYMAKGFEGIKYGTLNSNDPDSFNLVVYDENNVTWDKDQKSEVYRVISKTMAFQNLTTKNEIVDVRNGTNELKTKDVDKIIRKLAYIAHTK